MGYSLWDGMMFNIIPFIVSIGFIVIFGIILVQCIQGIRQWNQNNHSPVLTVDATVVTKRSEVHHHNHHTGDTMHHTTSTTYYVTFQVESGDRMELTVNGSEYGMLVEKDQGKLMFQGTRYLGFRRH